VPPRKRAGWNSSIQLSAADGTTTGRVRRAFAIFMPGSVLRGQWDRTAAAAAAWAAAEPRSAAGSPELALSASRVVRGVSRTCRPRNPRDWGGTCGGLRCRRVTGLRAGWGLLGHRRPRGEEVWGWAAGWGPRRMGTGVGPRGKGREVPRSLFASGLAPRTCGRLRRTGRWRRSPESGQRGSLKK
jgi:hypothetical protein